MTLPEASQKYLEVQTVGAGPGALGQIMPGRVAFRPQALSAIGTPVPARVLAVAVRPGEAVKAGAPMMILQSADAAAARAALDQALAKAAAAGDVLKRQTEMMARGVGLEFERFAAENAAREARAELERAEHAVEIIGTGDGDRFILRAPAMGVVLRIKANVGQVVSPDGEALVEVGDTNRLWVVADIPESEVGGLAVGEEAEVRVPGADAVFGAVVDGVGQVVDSDSRRLPIYVALRGATNTLSPGMLAEVRLSSAADSRIRLPATAVLIKDGSRRVVYVQGADGGFQERQVRTGKSLDGKVTILEGLKPGERVVVKGALLLDSEAEQLL